MTYMKLLSVLQAVIDSLVSWLIWCDYLLLKDFRSCGIMFMIVCVVITVATVMLLRDFGPFGLVFMAVSLLDFPVILEKEFINLL